MLPLSRILYRKRTLPPLSYNNLGLLFVVGLFSVIGAAIVVIGFYAVIWGKTQEKVEEDCTVYNSESYNDEVPLLQNKKMGE
ncbi:uncharacterized protein [Glycine max]|uniref:uncharacterized protein isoform X3 n=1 Tax=Glycine max TaxID=3847 RepID=UPI001B356F85|nr:uncharacterized protein LOC121175049 isoform X3 [Glycine max]